ncbi:myosin-9-like [Papaver somniferum]|uniref:myosin-9-like n=1 Tax=Papaver somniferum TaxID=3469 RepID=UPI000E6F716E|nr:myosin-9-like [Papaver somniferum]
MESEKQLVRIEKPAKQVWKEVKHRNSGKQNIESNYNDAETTIVMLNDGENVLETIKQLEDTLAKAEDDLRKASEDWKTKQAALEYASSKKSTKPAKQTTSAEKPTNSGVVLSPNKFSVLENEEGLNENVDDVESDSSSDENFSVAQAALGVKGKKWDELPLDRETEIAKGRSEGSSRKPGSSNAAILLYCNSITIGRIQDRTLHAGKESINLVHEVAVHDDIVKSGNVIIESIHEKSDDKQLEEQLEKAFTEYREAQTKLMRCKNNISAKKDLDLRNNSVHIDNADSRQGNSSKRSHSRTNETTQQESVQTREAQQESVQTREAQQESVQTREAQQESVQTREAQQESLQILGDQSVQTFKAQQESVSKKNLEDIPNIQSVTKYDSEFMAVTNPNSITETSSNSVSKLNPMPNSVMEKVNVNNVQAGKESINLVHEVVVHDDIVKSGNVIIESIHEKSDDKQLEEQLEKAFTEYREAQTKLMRCKNNISAKKDLDLRNNSVHIDNADSRQGNSSKRSHSRTNETTQQESVQTREAQQESVQTREAQQESVQTREAQQESVQTREAQQESLQILGDQSVQTFKAQQESVSKKNLEDIPNIQSVTKYDSEFMAVTNPNSITETSSNSVSKLNPMPNSVMEKGTTRPEFISKPGTPKEDWKIVKMYAVSVDRTF